MHRYLCVKNSFRGELAYSDDDSNYTYDGTPLTISGAGVLAFPNNAETETSKKISKFYNEIKFPNFTDVEDWHSLRIKGRGNLFTKQLDNEIKRNSKILEVGCGTGQLSLFLSRVNREVHAIDISRGSLDLAESFRQRNKIQNTYFFDMSVFDLHYANDTFDFVISNGALHHTEDAEQAFKILTDKTKPGGYVIVGLYHRYGRMMTRVRQKISKIIGEKVGLFDPHVWSLKQKSKKNSWILDQYFNPHETLHLPREVLRWCKRYDVELINLLPHFFDPQKQLLEKRPDQQLSLLKELILMFDKSQIREGGFFVLIGRKI